MFDLHLFGGAVLASETGPVVGRASQRRRLALLVLLARAGATGLARERLASLLWPEAGPVQSRHLLADSLYVLRSALGKDALIAVGENVRLDPRVADCDVTRFEAAVAGGELEKAVDLYAGDFLDGFFISGAPEFERWVSMERDRLALAYADALTGLGTSALDRGDAAAAVGWLRRAAERQPENSRVVFDLMRALVACGDRAQAIATADRHEAHLRAELDADADPIVAGYARRLRADGEAWEVPPLPPRISSRQRPVSEGSGRNRASRGILLGTGIVLAIALLAGARLLLRTSTSPLLPEEARARGTDPAIAVLPFRVNDAALATWREGMVDLLSINLDGVPGLRPIASRTVLARWREEAPQLADLQTMIDIARRTGARYALIGSAVTIGDEVRFGADLYNARSGDFLGSAQAQGSPDSVLVLIDRLSLDVVRALPQGEEGVLPRVDLAGITTTSLPALKAYLEGESHFRRGEFTAATESYTRAVETDSTFAMALSRLAESCGWGIPGLDCPDYLNRAMAHVDRLPPHAAMIVRANHAFFQGSLEGVEPLRRAVQKNPDDPEAWFLLGDTYEHMWQKALVDREEAGRAIGRAVELDPSFAPYYQHLVEHAINDADSLRARSLLETHNRLAPDSEWNPSLRLAFALNFGEAASRELARAVMDTTNTGTLFGTAVQALRNPGKLALQEEALRIVLTRPDAAPWMVKPLFNNLLQRGRFDAAHALLHDPSTFLPESQGRKWDAYRLYRAGMTLSEDQLERELELSEADTTADGALNHLLAGAYAVDREQWSDHQTLLSRARREAGRRRAAGDSVASRMFDGAARALEAYGDWKRGRAAEAFPRLQAVQREMRGGAGEWQAGESGLNSAVRWWLGEILLELGRPRDALVYFRTFDTSFGEYESAKIFESLGETDAARRSYEYALSAWRGADPELQPREDEAREALGRLRGPPRRQAP